MTRTTNARVAGATFLLYIAVGVTSMVIAGGAAAGAEVAAKVASLAQHATDVRIAYVLNLITCFAALVLAVTLYAITRDEDPDLAMLALTCRVGEGVLSGVFIAAGLGQLWLADAAGSGAPDAEAVRALGALAFQAGAWNPAAMFFAVGSTLFSWLLLRGRMIPVPLAWLGVVASVLLVVALPLELAGLAGPFGVYEYLPMLAFEVPLGLWLLIKGVAAPRAALAV